MIATLDNVIEMVRVLHPSPLEGYLWRMAGEPVRAAFGNKDAARSRARYAARKEAEPDWVTDFIERPTTREHWLKALEENPLAHLISE